jgi:hypothetical protein
MSASIPSSDGEDRCGNDVLTEATEWFLREGHGLDAEAYRSLRVKTS